MTDHLPNASPGIFMVPDTSPGALTNCECTDCREARLADPERITYTAHEMADAWKTGWGDGFASGMDWGARKVGDQKTEDLA